jgi:hypothetical protein
MNPTTRMAYHPRLRATTLDQHLSRKSEWTNIGPVRHMYILILDNHFNRTGSSDQFNNLAFRLPETIVFALVFPRTAVP